jgi:spoIIIJ-associated protein
MTDEEREPVEDEPRDGPASEAPEAGAAETEAPEAGAAETEGDAGDDAGSREHAPPFEGEVAPPAEPQEVAETAEEFIRGLLTAMGLEADVRTTVESDNVFVDVTGEGLGILIGRRGQALEALQEIARTAVQRKLRARIRLLVDVEGYRARRRSSLADYARQIAERAKDRGTEIELEPMTAYERKVVHDAVAEVEGATSFSEGEEPNRKVVVRGE